MSSVNKVILVGNLGNDPETRYMPDGSAVTNISVATSESWKDKQSGEKHEQTEWHRVAFFGKIAEIAAQYLKKGSKVYIEGRIKTTKYQDNNGIDKYSTSIIAKEMKMLDSKSKDGQVGQNNNQAATQPPPPPSNQPQGQHQKSEKPDFDDDIPF